MEKELDCDCDKRFSVLVVDRHAPVRSTLARRLGHAPGVSWVEEAATIDDAKRIIGGARPDVVLLDPGGWEGDWRTQLAALTSIRPPGSIIALHVARTHDGYMGEARALGADCIVLKGLKTSELMELLAREATAASQ
jgi:DNA-binding NarL/FixJ family response regulator